MLPTLRQRLMIAAAVVLGGLCWLGASTWVMAGDGSGGISLTDASAGTVLAVVGLALTGIPALLGALWVASTGHPLAGVFVASASLCFLSTAGGAGRGWMWRTALPGGYGGLILETLAWGVALAGLLVGIDRVRRALRPRLPQRLRTEPAALSDPDSPDEPTPSDPGDHGEIASLRPAPAGVGWPGGPGAVGLALAVVLGGVLCHILIRSPDVGQVVGALVLGFGLSAMVTELVTPQRSPAALVFAPLVVAGLAYAWIYMNYDSQADVLRALNTGRLTGLALALPIHYASAGVAGVAIGMGIGRSLNQARAAEG